MKYVVDMSESRMPLASACPAAKGSVCKKDNYRVIYFIICVHDVIHRLSDYLVQFNIFNMKFVVVEEPDVGCLKRGFPAGWLKYTLNPGR